MKKIGIVGGTAWVSTVEYYAAICRLGEEAGVQPEFSIESIDNARAHSYIGSPADEASWERFDAYHRAALENVERAGRKWRSLPQTRRTTASRRSPLGLAFRS